MFTYTPQEQIITEFIKMTPFKSWPFNRNIVFRFLVDPWLFFCVVIVVHESCVGPEQFNCLLFFRKIPSSCTFFSFPASSAYLNLFQNGLYVFEIHLFTLLRDSFATITEDSNTHWCSRRKKHALRAGVWKLFNRMEMCMSLILPKYLIFFI